VFCVDRQHRVLASCPTRRSSDLGYAESGVTLTVPGSVPGSAPCEPATVTSRFSADWSTAPKNPACAPSPRRIPAIPRPDRPWGRSEEHTSELQSRFDLVCRLLLE